MLYRLKRQNFSENAFQLSIAFQDLEGFDMYKDQTRYLPKFSKRGESGYDTALLTSDEWNKSMLHEFQKDKKGFAEMEVTEVKNGETGETYSLSSM